MQYAHWISVLEKTLLRGYNHSSGDVNGVRVGGVAPLHRGVYPPCLDFSYLKLDFLEVSLNILCLEFS